MLLCEQNRVDRFAERTDLIHFDKHGICGAHLASFFYTLCVCDKKIIAHNRRLLSEHVGGSDPILPIVLAHRVLDERERILLDPCFIHLDKLCRRECALVCVHDVALCFLIVKFATCYIHTKEQDRKSV